MKYHDGQEIKPNLKYTKTCALFEITKVGKYYHYQTDDCCNSHDGLISIKESKCFIKTKRSSLIGCIPDLEYPNNNKSDSIQEQEKLIELAKKWITLISTENDTLNFKLYENELKISNLNKDTVTLILDKQ